MATLTHLNDGLRSMIGNLGNVDRDKAAGLQIIDKCLTDPQLVCAFENNWIAQKMVMIPADDATRKWRNWQGELAAEMKAAERMMKLRAKTHEGTWKGDLFGGAAIYIGIEGQDPSEELDIDSVEKDQLTHLPVLTRTDLDVVDIDRRLDSPQFNKPSMYRVHSGGNNTIQADIHPSRLAIFNGQPRADAYRNYGSNRHYTRGWGRSSLQAAYDTILHSSGAFAGIASLLLEANVDVIGVPGMMKNIGTPGYEEKILSRFGLAAAGKGINGTLVLDADEDYNRRTASFANLDNIMDKLALFCAAAADIPATRFLGQTPSGLQSTGESDMRNYFDKISSMQTNKIEPALYNVDECLIRSTFGERPKDLTYEWRPLRQITELEEAEINEKNGRYLTALDSAVVSLESIYSIQKNVLGMFEGTSIDTFEDFEKSIRIPDEEIV